MPTVLCALGLGLFFYPEVFSGFHRMQWDIGDTRLLNLVLEQSYLWIKGFFTGNQVSLWDPPYFYPASNVAGYTDLFLGPAPIYWLLRAPGVAMDTAQQIFMIAVAALNFWVAFLWLRRPLKFGRFGASLGAFLFAFGFPRGVQLGHPALQPQFPMLLALYGLWRWFAPNRDRSHTADSAAGNSGAWDNPDGAAVVNGLRSSWSKPESGVLLFFTGCALQLLTGFYLGWFLALGLGLGLLAALATSAGRQGLWRGLKQHWLLTLVGAAAALALVGPMTLHYLSAAHEVGLRPFSAVFPPRIQAWFYLGHESLLYRWQDLLKGFRMLDYGPEQKIGIGFVTTILVLLGWRRLWKQSERGSAIRLLGFVSLALFILCTEFWPGVKLWRLVYEAVPGAKAIRALSRVGIVLLIPEAVGLAAFADGLLAKLAAGLHERGNAGRNRALAAAALVLIVALEQAHRAESFDKFELRDEVAELADQLDDSCHFFYYSPETDGREAEYRYQLDAMWVAYATGIPTLNGYSGNSPPGWGLYGSMIQSPADEKRLGSALADWTQARGLDPAGLCWVH